ncbi:rarD protein [Ferrimonas sediminum]|uniref:RarD protein n=1 Tax=Ferrimonas sediminum TaxID=718193 RepID=A0A1G8NVA4_9GAMM|nr:hypothetical protein [Ferrimonas sediminum]SDI84133.1 rarD protein [Ferrimonas sediminum]
MFPKLALLVAFSIFGLMPLYLPLMPGADVVELISLRIVMSAVLLLSLMQWQGQSQRILYACRHNRPALLRCALAAPLLGVGGMLSTWAFSHNQILAASMGQFLSPLLSMVLAVVVFRDCLNRIQMLALMLATVAVVIQFHSHADSIILALVLGGLFAAYGALKKQVQLDTLTSLSLEQLVVLPPALLYLGYLWLNGDSVLQQGDGARIAYHLGFGILILTAVILVNYAVKRISFCHFSLMQYYDPSLQFLLAVWVFDEACHPNRLLGFILIWGGLAAVIGTELWRRHRRPSMATTPPS